MNLGQSSNIGEKLFTSSKPVSNTEITVVFSAMLQIIFLRGIDIVPKHIF